MDEDSDEHNSDGESGGGAGGSDDQDQADYVGGQSEGSGSDGEDNTIGSGSANGTIPVDQADYVGGQSEGSGSDGEDNTIGSGSANGTIPVVSLQSSVANDIIKAVIKAMHINEVCGSQQNFLSILQYGKELYCKGDGEKWIQIPNRAICLSDEHPCTYSVLSSPEEECRYCHVKGSHCIKYLPLADKVKRWCSDERFCKIMTAHWTQRDHWLNRDLNLIFEKRYGTETDLQNSLGFGIPPPAGFCQSAVPSARLL